VVADLYLAVVQLLSLLCHQLPMNPRDAERVMLLSMRLLLWLLLAALAGSSRQQVLYDLRRVGRHIFGCKN
jgi:hypothetical protein